MALGQLRVELELDDGKFTTRVSGAGAALRNLQSSVGNTVSVTENLSTGVKRSSAGFVGWTIAIGEAREALQTIREVMTGWIEHIAKVNSSLEQTVILHKNLSHATDEVTKLNEAWSNYNQILSLAANTPFSMDQLTMSFVHLKTAGIEPTVKSMEALTDAVAAFGGDDQRLNRASYAIQEMAGRGVVSLTQLQRQLGQDIPGAVHMMARALNMSIGQLHEAVTKGTLESANAIQLLLDEMERTFGGSSAAQMNTFRGAVALVNTELLRLTQIAGGQQPGTSKSLSSFSAMTEAINKMSDAMKSNEAKSWAIALNDSLRELVKSVESVIEFFNSWGGTILTVTGYVVAFTVAAKAAQFAILGLEGISAFISALPAKMAMTGEVTAIGLVANAVVNVGSKLMAAGTVVAAFGARLMALIGSIFAAGEALGGFAGMAVTAVSGMTALSAALGFIVIPTAIIAGLALIIGKFQEWTRVADETGRAVGDALQGGVTSGTEAAAKSELANIDKKVETLRALEAALVKYQKNPSGSLLTGNMGQVERLLGKMKGFAGTEDFDPNKLGIGGFDFMKPGNIEKALPQIAAILSNWQNTLNEAHESVATIAERRMQADAERATDILMRSIKAGTQKFSTEYKVTIEQIERERDSLKGPAQAKNSPETIGLNNRAIEAAKNYYSQYEQYVLSAIASVQKKMDAATTDGDKSRYAMEIEALRKFYDEFTAAGKEKVDRFGHVVTIGEAKILEKQQHSAESMISTFQTHTAGLMSALDGGGTALARVNEMLSEHGKLAMIGAMNDQTLANTLRALASADDLAKEKTAALRDAMKADQSINTAYDKASADLKSYIARLVDPTMPEAQRSFAQLQSRMSTELVTYSINILRAKGLTEGFVDILREAKKVGDGISYAGLATVLHRIVTAEDEAAKARERNLTPSARLAAVSSRINSQYDALRRQVEGSSEETLAKFAGQYGLTGAPNKSDLLARLEGARQDELAQAGRAYDSAMHKAGMPAENEVAQLTGRIAQLKAELQGGKGEFEKFSAIFQAQPSKYAGSQQAILALAKEADALAEKLKKAHIAQQAMNTLENNAADAQERAALAGELMGQGKLLEIQKQILAYKVREAAEVRKTADFYGVDSPEVARAQALANTANQNNAEALVRTQVETMRTQTNQLRASFAERLSLRREYGEKEIDSEQAKLKTLIGMYETDATKRKEEETALSNYIAAKREDLERKTENGLEKMARKWSDVGANISQFGADAMDKLGDAIDQFVTTGKFKFSDFANWAISQLLKISAQAALSPILKFVGNSIGSWVGGLGGGSGGSTSGFTSALPTPEFHGGGVGGIDSVRMRHIEMSAFASAPRFHTGIGPGEFPAVLQQGEGVFTAGQMAAIGKLNYNYNAIQGVVAALADAVVAIPQAIGGALYSQNNGLYGASPANTAGGSNSAAAPIIHVHNQTQAPVTAEAKAPRFDGEKFIMDIVIKNIKSPGPMRNALRSMK